MLHFVSTNSKWKIQYKWCDILWIFYDAVGGLLIEHFIVLIVCVINVMELMLAITDGLYNVKDIPSELMLHTGDFCIIGIDYWLDIWLISYF